jgi:PLP dependent protein
MNISDNIKTLRKAVPAGIRIIAVSKTKSSPEIMEAYHAGQRDFGENKAQELLQKAPSLPPDIRWHFIGHLQSNKIKTIIPFIHLIHSIDSLKLLMSVDAEALKAGRVIDCLMEFHIATEETKFGLDPNEAEQLLRSEEFAAMKNIRITGVMGMASFSDDETLVRSEFRHLSEIFHLLKNKFFSHDAGFREISMGMSGDYPLAISEGSTMVRIGTAIFGERNIHF